MWKSLLTAGAAWCVAAGTAAAQFDGPFYATPGQPRPARVTPPPPPPPKPAAFSGENLFEVIPAGATEVPPTVLPPLPAEPAAPGEVGSPVNSGQPACNCPYASAPPPTLWASTEFLLWATRSVAVPPVVTTGSPGSGFGTAGVLGAPGTVPVFGGQSLLGSMRPGFRTEVGTWLDPRTAVSGRFFYLAQQSAGITGGSDGFTVVNVPQVVNVAGVPVQATAYVGFPGVAFGTVSASAHTNFLGGDLNLRRALANDPGLRFELLAGYRYLHLGDELNTAFDIAPTAAVAGVGAARIAGTDSVRTRNNFHGPQAGFAVGTRSGRWTADLQSTLAVGVTVGHADFDRTRATTTTVPGLGAVPAVLRGGAGGTSDLFAVVPEVGLKFGYQAAESVRLTAGYDFLYWSRVRRAQELYDLSGTLRGGGTDVWAQGLTLGLDVRY